MSYDEIHRGTRGTSGHSMVAVDENLSSTNQGIVNKLHNIIDMFFDIGLVDIQQPQTFVLYSYWPVKVL